MDVTLLTLAFGILGAILVVLGVAGMRGALPRNRWVGLRIKALRASDEAWLAGHRAGGLTLVLAGIPPLVVMTAMLIEPPQDAADWLLVYAVAGVITGGLIALAARQAERAATET